MSRYRTAGRFLLLCAVAGTAFLATDVVLVYLPAVPFAAVRFDVAAVLLFAAVLVSGVNIRPRTRDDYVYVLVGGVLIIGAHHAFLFAGQRYVTGGVAAVLLGLVPVVTPALTRLVSTDEEFTVATALGVALGFIGVVVIADPDPANLADSVLGVALVLASALAFAVAAVVTHSRSPSMPFLSTQAWMMAVGAVVLHTAVLALPGQSFATVTWTPSALGAIGYLSAVAGVGGFLLYVTWLEDLGPIEMSFIEYVIPVFAALAGWLVLGQEVTPATVIGFVFILSGFIAAKWRALRETDWSIIVPY